MKISGKAVNTYNFLIDQKKITEIFTGDDLSIGNRCSSLRKTTYIIRRRYMTRQDVKDYLNVKDFCREYSSVVSMRSLRWILLNSKFNGADYFVRRIGKRKLLISPQLFFEWLESNKRGKTK